MKKNALFLLNSKKKKKKEGEAKHGTKVRIEVVRKNKLGTFKLMCNSMCDIILLQ
jgi:hypothetical protein